MLESHTHGLEHKVAFVFLYLPTLNSNFPGAMLTLLV